MGSLTQAPISLSSGAPILVPNGEVSRAAPRLRSWADPVESDSCQEAGSGGQWDVCWGWREGEIGQGLGPGVAPPTPAQPCGSTYCWPAWAARGGAGRTAWIGL